MLSFIVAMDEARGIGYQNRLPDWNLPADLAYFKSKTVGRTIVMGRKTFESLGSKPLPKRTNVVLTTNSHLEAPGCIVVHSVQDILGLHDQKPDEEMMVIGGTELFKVLLPFAQRLYITEITGIFATDVTFPELDSSQWTEVSRTPGLVDERNRHPYAFVVYERADRNR